MLTPSRVCTYAEAMATLRLIEEKREQIALYIIGEFDLTAGALVAVEPPLRDKQDEPAPSSRVVHDLTPAAAESMPANACAFPASASGEVFHEAGCGNAERISPGNLVCYETREQAIKAGRRPAGCCKP